MKKVIVVLVFVIMLMSTMVMGVSAAESDANELYSKQYSASGVEDLNNLLSKDIQEALEDFGIDPSDPQSFGNFNTKNVFATLWGILTENFKETFSAIIAIIGVLFIFSAVDGLMIDAGNAEISVFACFMAVIFLLKPVYLLVSGIEAAIKGVSSFMVAFVPVYAGVIASSGSLQLAGGYSALLLAAAEGIMQFLAFAFVPIASSTMSLGIMGSISPISAALNFAEWIKKCAVWVMGIITTIFLSILSIQTTISAAADSVGIRTSKAVISGSIPIMGPAIAETLNTARGCLGLLRSGVGIYGVVVIVLLALPFLLKLLIWRLGMWLCLGVCEIFCLAKVSGLFRAVDFCLSILLGAVCFTLLLFVISITIILKVAS